MTYPFSTIWINGRDISIEAIRNETALPASDFERATFTFIREWLSDQTIFEIQTSGSTGTPKKIILTREQMLASAHMTEQALALKPGYTALVCLHTQYIAGRMMLVRCFATGMRIVVTEPAANPLANIPDSIAIDFTAWVPYQLYAILSSPEAARLNSIGCVIIGGAPLNQEIIHELQAYSCIFYATYGMTETISHIALQTLNGINASSVFRALPGIALAIDERGCLTIDAHHLPEKIVTNDLVELKDNHAFLWLGRWDNVINSGGIKIIPEHLESRMMNTLYECGILRPFFIASVPDKKLGEKITLLLEGEALDEEKKYIIHQKIKQTFSSYETPKDIITLPKFLYTNTDKIDRRKTIEMITKRS
ncbi:AMP-binding protein [Ohtaekwangia kribbensis]|jgi:O-succinylbenzoic acid--CoA ligase|uniref:AMP-binding protein n=1 Tax=Ohtaekwangia kribbensis TaxID=688913 RepID=A0ABW3KCJ2_9BACT